jgi:ApaG protein
MIRRRYFTLSPIFAVRAAVFCGGMYHEGRTCTQGQGITKVRQRTPMAAYDLTVSVKTQYLPEQSEPDKDNYVFAYTITIKNTGTVASQLISRHWVITDANNRVQEVRGLGVVGHQPLLQPGEQFEYSSGTQMATPQGSMVGEYFCVAEDGHRFEANIPEFVLSLPRTLH